MRTVPIRSSLQNHCSNIDSDNRHPKSRKLSPVKVRATLQRNTCEDNRW
jgi:hypothetical protein